MLLKHSLSHIPYLAFHLYLYFSMLMVHLHCGSSSCSRINILNRFSKAELPLQSLIRNSDLVFVLFMLVAMKLKVKSLSCVRVFATPWTVDYQAPQSMEFSRQKYWSGLLFPSPGDLPNPGIEPRSPSLQAYALPSEPPGKPKFNPIPSSPKFQESLDKVYITRPFTSPTGLFMTAGPGRGPKMLREPLKV